MDDAMPVDFLCAITLEPMQDPVVCADGHSYERAAIEYWLTSHATSPKTGAVLDHANVVPNHALRSRIEAWRVEHRASRAGAPASSHSVCGTSC